MVFANVRSKKIKTPWDSMFLRYIFFQEIYLIGNMWRLSHWRRIRQVLFDLKIRAQNNKICDETVSHKDWTILIKVYKKYKAEYNYRDIVSTGAMCQNIIDITWIIAFIVVCIILICFIIYATNKIIRCVTNE